MADGFFIHSASIIFDKNVDIAFPGFGKLSCYLRIYFRFCFFFTYHKDHSLFLSDGMDRIYTDIKQHLVQLGCIS